MVTLVIVFVPQFLGVSHQPLPMHGHENSLFLLGVALTAYETGMALQEQKHTVEN